MTSYFKSTPTFSLNQGIKVDRATARINGLSLFQAHVECLGHGVMGDEITLAQISRLGNIRSNGLKSRLTHPGMSEDGTGKQVAIMRNFRIQNDKVIGDAQFLESARKSPMFSNDPVDYLMTFAEESPDQMGMSVVVKAYGVMITENGEEIPSDEARDYDPDEFVNKMPILRVQELRAADFVDDPAANRDGMFGNFDLRSFSTGTTSAQAEDLFNYLDMFLAEQGMSPEKAYQFAMRYFGSRLRLSKNERPNLSYRSVLESLALKRP